MKSKKTMIIILVLLIIVCLTGGFLGLFQSMENKKNLNPTPNTGDYEIVYEYFVEVNGQEVQQNELPINPEGTVLYSFDKATCTNRVEGEWNQEEWKYDVTATADSTCRLYFVRANYEVNVNVTNGTADVANPKYFERLKDAYLKIVPEEGYEYESVTCSGEKEASWDAENNELVIVSVDADITCNVKMKLKKLTLDINVSEGTSAGKETADYGTSVKAIVTPRDGYGTPSVSCTNNQIAQWANNNELTIATLTNNTVCTVRFLKQQVSTTTYTLTLTQTNLVLTTGAASQQVAKGGTVTWVFKVNDGFTFQNITCPGISASAEVADDDKTVTVTVSNVTKSATCAPNITQN